MRVVLFFYWTPGSWQSWWRFSRFLFFFFKFNPTMIVRCLKFIWREIGELNITWASLHVKEHEKIGLPNCRTLWVKLQSRNKDTELMTSIRFFPSRWFFNS